MVRSRKEKGTIYIEDKDKLILAETELVGAVLPCWDFENQKTGICFTGRDKNGMIYKASTE